MFLFIFLFLILLSLFCSLSKQTSGCRHCSNFDENKLAVWRFSELICSRQIFWKTARMRKTDLPRLGLQWGHRVRMGEKFLCCASRKRDDLKGASRWSRRRGRRSSRSPRRRTTQDGEASHERRRQRPDVTQPTLAWRPARKARILPSFGWKNWCHDLSHELVWRNDNFPNN